jgi:phage shock protein A
MEYQDDLRSLTTQSISLRSNVEGLELQMMELNQRVAEAKAESQAKDRYVTYFQNQKLLINYNQ